MGWTVLVGIEGVVEGAAEDAIEGGAVEGAVELIGGANSSVDKARMPRFEVCIDNATRFKAVLVLGVLLVAL